MYICNFACQGWDAPMQGDNQDRLEAEAQLTEKWHLGPRVEH